MRKALVACAALGLLSCGKQHEAGIMLVMPSELSVPEDIDNIRIQVVHKTRGELVRQDIPMPAGEWFPMTYGIGPSRTNQMGPYTFRVIGMLKGKAKTLREAVADVPTVDVREMKMPIEFLCYDQVITLGDGQVIGRCPEGQTCIAGDCKPIPVYESKDLPVYVEPAKPVDSGPSCYDALGCFASPVLLFADRTTCRVPKPVGATNFTVGLILPQDKPGVPFRGKKLVVFNADGVAAWRDAGAEVQLPSGICTILDQIPEATLVASTTCSNKKEDLPLCKVPASSVDAAIASIADADAASDATADVTLAAETALPDALVSQDVLPDSNVADLGIVRQDVGFDVAPLGVCEAPGGGFQEAGVSCDGGVCNGTGRCGQCRPGARQCSGNTQQICSADGTWVSGTTCLSVCMDGTCQGVCTPGVDKQCKGDNQTLQTCDATGHYVDSETCPFVCLTGACTGVCRPGAKDCSGNTPRTCGADGQWVNGTVCPYVCSTGACTGVCSPGSRRCLGTSPQVCAPAATWQSEAACAYACAGAGVCQSSNVMCWGDDRHKLTEPKPGIFTAVSAGGFHACGLRPNGAIDCWGLDDFGQAASKAGPFVAVSAARDVTCGLRVDRTAECWGLNKNGESTPKAGTYTSLSSGGGHICGVRDDGTLSCWGRNERGQSTPNPGVFKEVSTRASSTCALRPSGAIECWGTEQYGQTLVEPGEFTSVSTGAWHACGLRPNGAVDCWGDNSEGQAASRQGPFMSLSTGGFFTCGLRADGTAECWGNDGYGQLDLGSVVLSSISTGDFATCGIVKP